MRRKRGDQLEEALGREVAPDAADARSQAVREIAREQVARHGVERAPALQEAPQRRQLGIAQATHVPGGQLTGLGRLDGPGGLRDDCRGARLAHHERAGREVAEALVLARVAKIAIAPTR